MRTNHTALYVATILALLCPAFVVPAQETTKSGTATVMATHRNPQYSKGDEWHSAQVNMVLAPGTTLRTDPESRADVLLKDDSSAVGGLGLRPLTEMQFVKLTEQDGATSIILDLKSGRITGEIYMRSSNSVCEIHTPNGMARIRNASGKANKRLTEFVIEAVPQPDGTSRVTYTCLKGEMTCSAMINGESVSTIVRPRRFWAPGLRSAHHSAAWLTKQRYEELQYLVEGPILRTEK